MSGPGLRRGVSGAMSRRGSSALLVTPKGGAKRTLVPDVDLDMLMASLRTFVEAHGLQETFDFGLYRCVQVQQAIRGAPLVSSSMLVASAVWDRCC
jgi:hypothetical protein